MMVAVEAEWALWGKEEGDEQDYHLLRHSTGGEIDRRIFIRQLTRYSPGTLDQLPEVSFSWIKRRSDGHGSHLAIAFHETARGDSPSAPPRGLLDAGGREIVFVRYFCVRWEELARHSVSYEALYEGLGDVMLPAQDGKPVRVELRAEPVPVQPEARGIAEAVAAQLLTASPVCIIGGSDVGRLDRLRFLDQVLALLPYGARNCMSASTWVDSSHKHHRFRLFFASAARSSGGPDGYGGYGGPESDDDFGEKAPDDTVLDLSQLSMDPDVVPVVGRAPTLYLNWVRQAQPSAISQLARLDTPVHLGIKAEVDQAIADLPSPLHAEIEVILERIATARRDEDTTRLDEWVGQLRRQLAKPGVVVDRAKCQEIIADGDLLREGKPQIPPRSHHALLDALLAVAVGASLSYQGYRKVLQCARGNLHYSLLRAMNKLSTTGPVPVILIGHRLGFGDEALFSELRRQACAPEDALRALADDAAHRPPAISRQHGVIVYDVGLRYMLADLADARLVVRDLGYLDGVMAYLYPDGTERLNKQRYLLGAAYRKRRLDRADVKEILQRRNVMPSPVLVHAVRSMTRWKRLVASSVYKAWAGDADAHALWPLPKSRRRRGGRGGDRQVPGPAPGRPLPDPRAGMRELPPAGRPEPWQSGSGLTGVLASKLVRPGTARSAPAYRAAQPYGRYVPALWLVAGLGLVLFLVVLALVATR